MNEWVWDPENTKIVAAFSTLAAAIIASATALFVSVFSYSRQKRLDREYEHFKETRQLYRDFLQRASKFTALLDEDSGLAEVESLRGIAIEMMVIGQPAFASQALSLVQAIEESRSSIENSFRETSKQGSKESAPERSDEFEELQRDAVKRIADEWLVLGSGFITSR